MMNIASFVFLVGAKMNSLVIALNVMNEGSDFCPTSAILIVIG
jgi:hypothetical protein